MTQIEGKEYWKNGKGDLVCIDNIKEIDQLRNNFVLEKANEILAMHEQLKLLKQSLFADFAAFEELSHERYGVKVGGAKGNITLPSFSGEFVLSRSINDDLTFNEGLQAAKILIDECVREWTKDSASNVQTLINHAFRVDKQGKINTGAVLSLRTLKISDPKWQMAMDAIADSLTVASTRGYIRLHRRNDYGVSEAVSLDIARL